MARTVEDIEADIRNDMAERAAKIIHRDQRAHDLEQAQADIASYNRTIAAHDTKIDNWFDERARQILANLDALVS